MANFDRVHLPPLQGAWLHAQNAPQQRRQTVALQPPPAFGDPKWKPPAQEEKRIHFPAPAPSLKLDRATLKRKEYRHTLAKCCTGESITLQLQAHAEGSLINRAHMLEVFREYWANQSPAISPPYQIEHLRLFGLWVSATNDNSELAGTYFAADDAGAPAGHEKAMRMLVGAAPLCDQVACHSEGRHLEDVHSDGATKVPAYPSASI